MEVSQGSEHQQSAGQLGSLLCWAVVFADIGSSIYYVPGILYGWVGNLAGFFVLLTMTVFVLLTLKYAEVSARFPEGGGVVTVAAQAISPWVGALGGMFILVSYFLTAAISCLSAIQYFTVVVPSIRPFILVITLGILLLLGLLNWIGISESAKVSLVGAFVAFVSDLAIIWMVFTHIPISESVRFRELADREKERKPQEAQAERKTHVRHTGTQSVCDGFDRCAMGAVGTVDPSASRGCSPSDLHAPGNRQCLALHVA